MLVVSHLSTVQSLLVRTLLAFACMPCPRCQPFCGAWLSYVPFDGVHVHVDVTSVRWAVVVVVLMSRTRARTNLYECVVRSLSQLDEGYDTVNAVLITTQAYFQGSPPEEAPLLSVPQHAVIKLSPSNYGWQVEVVNAADLPPPPPLMPTPEEAREDGTR